jgi:hypothetical protein
MSVSRRRIWIGVAVVALLLTFGLWLAATVESSPLTRSLGPRKVPKVVAGRDEAVEDDRRVVRTEEDVGVVRCAFEGEGEPGTLAAMGGGDVLTSGSDLTLRLPAGTWTIIWQSPERGALPLGKVDAEPGEVATCTLSERGWALSGTVRNLEGQGVPGTFVYACGSRTRTDASGAFVGLGRAGECAVRAVYHDGILSRRSDPVVVDAFDGRGIELVVDDTPVAGMGLGFAMVETGARVRMIHPGTPAEEAGLQEGDIIVRIDGQPTAGLSDDAFIAVGTGREGSRIDLEVERGGELRSFSFHRERIEQVDTG